MAFWLSADLAHGAQNGACKRRALAVPVTVVNQRPVVLLKVQGENLPMLLDSGAFFSFLLPATADALKLKRRSLPPGFALQGYTGAIEGELTTASEVELQGLSFKNVEFIVGANELGSGIRGILGRNFLSFSDIEYDLAHGMLRLHFLSGDCDEVAPAYWAEGAPVIEARLDIGPGDRALRVPVRINGKRMSAELDTGAAETSLTSDAAWRAGIAPEAMTEVGRVGGAGGGSVKVWRTTLDRFELGDQTILKQPIRVDDVPSPGRDLLLGLDYFLSHRIYVAYGRRKLYATWLGGTVFGAGAVQGARDAQNGAWVPPAPLPDDADALARQAAAAHTRGDTAMALRLLGQAIEQAPTQASFRLERARVRLQAGGAAAQAAHDLDEALRLKPGLQAALWLRAKTRVADGQQASALADLAELDQALRPQDALRADLAELYAQLVRSPEALRQWALWLAPRSQDQGRGRVLTERCRLRVRLGEALDEAQKDCTAAIELDPKLDRPHETAGWLLLRRGHAEAAHQHFGRALALNANNAWSWYGRSLAQRHLGQAPQAQQDLARARALNSGIDAEVAAFGFAAQP